MKRTMALTLTALTVTAAAATPAQAASSHTLPATRTLHTLPATPGTPTLPGAPALHTSPGTPAVQAPQTMHAPQMQMPRMKTLTVADNGRHIRVPQGEHIMVQLKVRGRNADPSTYWHPITEQGKALQTRVVGTMIPRGVTAGHYFAVRRGEATLSSSRAACPSTPGIPTCHAMQGWTVTIDVR